MFASEVFIIFSLFAIKHFPFVFILNSAADCASELTAERSSVDRKCDECLFFALTLVRSLVSNEKCNAYL